MFEREVYTEKRIREEILLYSNRCLSKSQELFPNRKNSIYIYNNKGVIVRDHGRGSITQTGSEKLCNCTKTHRNRKEYNRTIEAHSLNISAD